MNEMTAQIRAAAKALLSDNRVDVLVGYEKGTLPLRTRPSFVSSTDDVQKLVWDSFCSNNLAAFLPRMFEKPPHVRTPPPPPKVGIVAKGCDLRSVVGFVKENQAPRENVVVIGVPCRGIVDLRKLEIVLEGDGVVACEEDAHGTLHLATASGGTRAVAREQVIADACQECEYPGPDGADVSIEGEARAGRAEKQHDCVDRFAGVLPADRWRYFESEMRKCIGCHACRQACPNCYCNVCFVDQGKPRWVAMGDDLSDRMLFHIGRTFHQAGRCVECSACVRACPMNIDLLTFTRKLSRDVKELFGYTPGLSLDEPAPLCAFCQDDPENFITEP